jgi:glycerol-3-phosphate cytidylyltransferase-like family protein
MKTIVISSDHNGVEDKEQLKTYLKGEGYRVIDIGPYTPEVSVDYVDYAAQLSTIVSNKEADRGILLCGTGVGMSIVANRYPGVRAVLAHNELTVAIDSDRRVKELKGNDRPINNQEDRRRILETNRYVDEVVIFDSVEELQGFYDTLSPNVIVKGSEWTADEVRERDNIPENVQIKVYPLVGDYSTTNTMHKIRDMETCEKI